MWIWPGNGRSAECDAKSPKGEDSAAPSDFSRARFGGRVGISLQRDRSKSVDIFDQAAWARFSPSARSAGRCRAQRHAVWRRCHGRRGPVPDFYLLQIMLAGGCTLTQAGRSYDMPAGLFGGHQFQPALHEDVVLRRAPAHDTHRAKPAGARIAGLDRARTEGTDLIRSITGVRDGEGRHADAHRPYALRRSSPQLIEPRSPARSPARRLDVGLRPPGRAAAQPQPGF